jgi:secondary thiamine-phosphate synthase enzyme
MHPPYIMKHSSSWGKPFALFSGRVAGMLKPSDWLLEPRAAPGFIRNEIVAKIEDGRTVHHTEYLHFKIPSRYALVNITDQVEESLARSRVEDGFCFVSAMHITAGVYINDAESGLLNDIARWIENLAPYGKNYLHHQTGEDNGDAHLKSYLTNHALTAPVTRGRLDFGTWQQIFYAEFDGLRDKRVLVKITGLRKS